MKDNLKSHLIRKKKGPKKDKTFEKQYANSVLEAAQEVYKQLCCREYEFLKLAIVLTGEDVRSVLKLKSPRRIFHRFFADFGYEHYQNREKVIRFLQEAIDLHRSTNSNFEIPSLTRAQDIIEANPHLTATQVINRMLIGSTSEKLDLGSKPPGNGGQS